MKQVICRLRGNEKADKSHLAERERNLFCLALGVFVRERPWP